MTDMEETQQILHKRINEAEELQATHPSSIEKTFAVEH
jgi:hypothetical protein